MLKDLYSPLSFPSFPSLSLPYSNPTVYQWSLLQSLFTSLYPDSSISFQSLPDSWIISETIDDLSFSLSRSKLSLQRLTTSSSLPLLGLSDVNLSDRRVILTEGVSDYFTARLLCPNSNVLGLTSLSGSLSARRILVSLFDKFIYVSDSDSAGRSAFLSLKTYLQSYSKSVTLFLPPPSFKDISQSFVFNYKTLHNV